MSWGALAGMAIGAFGQRSANRQNIRLMREANAFTERMSNTAYTRAARDLENAGLNRILALGSPASTPGAQMATVGNIGTSGIEGATALDSVSTAKKQRDVLEAEASLKESQSEYFDEMAGKVYKERVKLDVETQNLIMQRAGIITAAQRNAMEAEIARLRIAGVKSEEEFFKWLMEADANEFAKAAGDFGPLLLRLMQVMMITQRGTK
jgi:hypothetical protein